MANLFISDTHFNHQRIIAICRPRFTSIEQMNQYLIDGWNSRVKPGDIIYHLGDFGWKDSEPVLRKLNGQKFLITGSHDSEAERLKKYFCQLTPMKEIKIGDQHVVMSHCAMRVWEKSHYGAWHLYGHSHGNLPPWGKSFDVGVDAHDYLPWTWDEVVAKMATLEENKNDIRYRDYDRDKESG
jgi:calcineurin-like phosphoesterase family protein